MFSFWQIENYYGNWNDIVPIDEIFESSGQPRIGSVKFYIDRLEEEAYEGSGQSLRQRIFTRVAEKLDTNDGDENFEKRLRREKEEKVQFGRKKDVHLPTTLHLIRGILGGRELWQLEFHICDCQFHFWQPLHPSRWFGPNDERHVGTNYICPFCDGPRFQTTKEVGGRHVPTPVSVSKANSNLLSCD
jgi:hypothetical protein